MLDQWPDEDRRWRLFQNYWFNCIRDCVRQVQRRDRGNSTCWRQDHIPLMIHHPACPGGRECAAVTGDRAYLSMPTTWTGVEQGRAFTESGGWAFALVREDGAWRVCGYGWAPTARE